MAIAAPIHQPYDYRLPAGWRVSVGARVLVPLRQGRRIGFVVPRSGRPAPAGTLKTVIEVIDEEPLFDDELFSLLSWAADYYRHPPGEVLEAALPVRHRRRLAAPKAVPAYRLASAAEDALAAIPGRAHRQRQVVEALADGGTAPLAALRERIGDCGDAVRRLLERGVLEPVAGDAPPAPVAGPALNPMQAEAVERIDAAAGEFGCFLLKGVTGSGKTEVYLQLARRTIARGRGVLVLVPEIALTPQLVGRFRERLGQPVAVLHSALAEGERQRAWLRAAGGEAKVVLGTRSAVFCPMPHLGLVIIDEEHDTSFKQQDGFRYHARDVAIKRASVSGLPVVLGSATPSLESWHNCRSGRYTLLQLPERAGGARMPSVSLVDMDRFAAVDGLTAPLLRAIAERIERGEQSLVFINRRGYSPVMMCTACQWQARCERCDAFLTLHRREARLRCHHCGHTRPAVAHCPACGHDELYLAGVGTQRVEQALAERFPTARVARIDRDTTPGGALAEQLARVGRGEVDILVGTQLLSKGHDFPGITLVGVLNADQGMYSVDFRAPERLFQTVTQVAGRAGRGARPGQVLVQTRFGDHPCMTAVQRQDYALFAEAELAVRRTLGMPPFGHLALLRAESALEQAALSFLTAARQLALDIGLPDGVEVMDPVPAPMERRAGRFRAQLMIQARARPPLRRLLAALAEPLGSSRQARRVRWSLDVDPVDLY